MEQQEEDQYWPCCSASRTEISNYDWTYMYTVLTWNIYSLSLASDYRYQQKCRHWWQWQKVTKSMKVNNVVGKRCPDYDADKKNNDEEKKGPAHLFLWPSSASAVSPEAFVGAQSLVCLTWSSSSSSSSSSWRGWWWGGGEWWWPAEHHC